MKKIYSLTKRIILLAALLFSASATFAQSVVLAEWPFSSDISDSLEATGVTAETPTLTHFYTSTVTATPAYSIIWGQAISPNDGLAGSGGPGDGHWKSGSGYDGPGGTLNFGYYEQFVISANSGYTLTADSLYLYSAISGTTDGAYLMAYYSTSGFTLDSNNLYMAGFSTPITVPERLSSTAPLSNLIQLAFTSSGGVTVATGDSLTVRIYYAVGSTTVGRFALTKDVIINGTVGTTGPVCISEPGAFTASSATVCQGATGVVYTVPLNDTATSYTWSYSGTGATFTSTTNSVSIDYGSGATSGTLSVIANAACGSSPAETLAITVDPLPLAGTITGSATLCTGSMVTFTDAGSTGTGSWSSSNTGVASVDPTSGVVTGVAAGSANITYTATSGSCGSANTDFAVTVGAALSAGTITAATTSVCPGASISFTVSGSSSAGTWSSSLPGIASVDPSTGEVTGVSAGSANISYIVTGSCGSVSTYSVVTVNSLASAGTISGTSPICLEYGAVFTDAGATGTGTWSSSNTAVATVDPASGSVSGVGTGAAVISYEVINSCGAAYAAYSVTVSIPVPLTASITVSGDIYTLTTNATTYMADWYVNAVLNTSLTNTPTWSYTVAPGTTDVIAAIVTPLSGCFTPDSLLSDTLDVVGSTEGVKSITANSNIAVYPNPFTDHFMVTGCSQGDMITVTDLTGNEVIRYTCKGNNGGESISMATWSPGVYLVRAVSQNGSQLAMQEIIKK